MKRLPLVAALLIAAGLSGCSPISVRTDYDRDVDFNKYQTFRWMPYPQKAKRKMVVQNSLLDKRIRKAVVSELEARGYKVKKSGKVDALLAYHIAVRNRVEVDHYGYRYWRRYTHVHRYKEGSIIIDVVDPAMKQLVWRGAATGLSSHLEHSAEQIKEAIAKVFEKYPPG